MPAKLGMTKADRSEAELVQLRKLAQEFAATRKERLTSLHLLAAVAAGQTVAADLLRERRLERDGLLKAGRSFDDDSPDSINRILTAAREFARRSPGVKEPGREFGPAVRNGEPDTLHLLLAIVADRRSAAHRALSGAGVDIARLRARAMSIALGATAPRRIPAAISKRAAPSVAAPTSVQPAVPSPLPPPSSEPVRSPSAKPRGRGVTVPLLPPHPKPSAPRPVAVDEIPPARRTRRARRASPAPAPSVEREGALDPKRFPMLSTVGKDLGELAKLGRLPRVIGREAEIERTLDVLAKMRGNVPCLVGPAGVGKTSVVYGVAQRLAEEGRRSVIEVAIGPLSAGTHARGSLSERLVTIAQEVEASEGEVILFFDGVQELLEGSGADEALVELKRLTTQPWFSMIAATTWEQYRRVIEVDPVLSRRLSLVEIEPPAEADAFLICRDACERLSEHHGVAYSDEAIAAMVSWSLRYAPARPLPDQPLALLDLAGAQVGRRSEERGAVVELKDAAHVMSEAADVPVSRLLQTDGDRMLQLEELVAERVVGHQAEVAAIARHLRRNAAGLRGRRPIGTFLLLGPTGVGKTECAKAIAEVLFQSADAMTRLDLSEFAEAHAVARLVGAPPGYIGHEAGGQLTESVRRRPYQVVLLDEIEKAHRDVLEAMLSLFDEGHMTDGRGKRVDFTNTVIILTSNLGTDVLRDKAETRAVGFGRSQRTGMASIDDPGALALHAAQRSLPPELYNRFDEVLFFHPLTRSEVAKIAELQLGALVDALAMRQVRLSYDPEVVDALLDAGGFDQAFGARPMRRTIARLVEAPVAELLLRGEVPEDGVLHVSVVEGTIDVDVVSPAYARSTG